MGQDLERLLNAIPIESYIERVVALKKRGANYIGLCPFHSEKTPSFSVSPSKGIFKCFGCGKGGNLITFVQEYEKVGFRDALQILSRYSGVPLENKFVSVEKTDKNKQVYAVLEWLAKLYQSELAHSLAYQYLSQRKVDAKSMAYFQLGYAPDSYHFLQQKVQASFQEKEKIETVYKILLELGLLAHKDDGGYYNRFRNRLMFPIQDGQKRVVGFGGRQITPNEKSAKYINSSESAFFNKKEILFHFAGALEMARKNNLMIVVEGYFDVLGLYQKGLENCVASMGTAFTFEQGRLIKRYCETAVLFFDSDVAGMDAALKSFVVCKEVGLAVKVVNGHVGKNEKSDPFDLAQTMDNIDFFILIDNAKSEFDFILWYFFSYKYNIEMIEQKGFAIEGFFEFVKQLPLEWEKEEYLKKAAKVLDISQNSFLRDFRKGHSNYSHQKKQPQQPITMQKFLHSEKDFISIMLYFPEFWVKENLLEQMHWQSQILYLLYSFFRDRAKVGEVFQLGEEKKNTEAKIISQLPQEFIEPFSEIALESHSITLDEEKDKTHYFKVLQTIAWQSAFDYYQKESEVLRQKIKEKEKEFALSQEQQLLEEMDDLIDQHQLTNEQKNRYFQLLQKSD